MIAEKLHLLFHFLPFSPTYWLAQACADFGLLAYLQKQICGESKKNPNIFF